MSNVKVEDQAQASVMLIASEDTEDLFADDVAKGDEEPAQVQDVQDQTNLEDDNTRHEEYADLQE